MSTTFPRTAAEWRVKELYEFVWPITWRWHMRGPFGDTRQELTLDVPALYSSLEPSMKLGAGVWARAIAPAITHDVELIGWDTVMWRLAPAGLPMTTFGMYGGAPGPTAARDDSGCVILHTGHDDSLARRRMFYPGIPAGWVHDGLLTGSGMQNLQTVTRGAYIGMSGQWNGGPYRWLIAYPGLLTPTIDNGDGVAFRTVEYLRVCQHTEKAPLLSGEPWPS